MSCPSLLGQRQAFELFAASGMPQRFFKKFTRTLVSGKEFRIPSLKNPGSGGVEHWYGMKAQGDTNPCLDSGIGHGTKPVSTRNFDEVEIEVDLLDNLACRTRQYPFQRLKMLEHLKTIILMFIPRAYNPRYPLTLLLYSTYLVPYRIVAQQFVEVTGHVHHFQICHICVGWFRVDITAIERVVT